MLRWPAIASLVALTSLGCGLVDIDLAGRSCPCIAGWACNKASNTCVHTVGDGPEGAIEVLSFKAEWATPNAIRWSWQVQGSAPDFSAFQLAMGTSAEEVVARSRLVTGGENPELDRFALPHTSGDDPVVGTITYGLEPGTKYYAELLVIDSAGNVSTSPNVAQKSTAAAPKGDHLDLFVDAVPMPGYVQPTCMMVDSAAYMGTAAMAYVNHCEPVQGGDPMPVCDAPATPAPLCWQNLFLENLGIPVDGSVFTTGAFGDAYLEVAVRVDGSQPAWWSSVGLRPGDGATLRSLNPITFRADGAYRLYQFKLDAFPVTYEELVAGGIWTFFIGGPWSDGATVRFDEARIWW